LQTAAVAGWVLSIFRSTFSAHLPGEAGIIFCGGTYWKQDSRIGRTFVVVHCQNVTIKWRGIESLESLKFQNRDILVL